MPRLIAEHNYSKQRWMLMLPDGRPIATNEIEGRPWRRSDRRTGSMVAAISPSPEWPYLDWPDGRPAHPDPYSGCCYGGTGGYGIIIGGNDLAKLLKVTTIPWR